MECRLSPPLHVTFLLDLCRIPWIDAGRGNWAAGGAPTFQALRVLLSTAADNANDKENRKWERS